MLRCFVIIEILCHSPCEPQHSFSKASCLERCLPLSLQKVQTVFKGHTPGAFHTCHINPAISLVLGFSLLQSFTLCKRDSLQSCWKTKLQQGAKGTSDAGCPRGFDPFQKDSRSTVVGQWHQGLCMDGVPWAKRRHCPYSRHHKLTLQSMERNLSWPMQTLKIFWINWSVKLGWAQRNSGLHSTACAHMSGYVSWAP